jgi:predicted acetyltransferase
VTTTRDAERPPAHIEVIPATADQQPIFANLLELYIHDFSEFHNLELGANGRFGYEHLPLYWVEPDRHPFLLRLDGKLAGFALVKRGSEFSGNEAVWDMAEFFILRAHRRCGVGTAAAHQVWKRFPGQWEVRVMESNHAAHHFWQHAITEFSGKSIHPVRIEKDGGHWHLFSFQSGHVA